MFKSLYFRARYFAARFFGAGEVIAAPAVAPIYRIRVARGHVAPAVVVAPRASTSVVIATRPPSVQLHSPTD